MSKQFVIAWINFFDNELHQEAVYCSDYRIALDVSKQDIVDSADIFSTKTLKELKIIAFNCDGMISVIEF